MFSCFWILCIQTGGESAAKDRPSKMKRIYERYLEEASDVDYSEEDDSWIEEHFDDLTIEPVKEEKPTPKNTDDGELINWGTIKMRTFRIGDEYYLQAHLWWKDRYYWFTYDYDNKFTKMTNKQIRAKARNFYSARLAEEQGKMIKKGGIIKAGRTF